MIVWHSVVVDNTRAQTFVSDLLFDLAEVHILAIPLCKVICVYTTMFFLGCSQGFVLWPLQKQSWHPPLITNAVMYDNLGFQITNWPPPGAPAPCATHTYTCSCLRTDPRSEEKAVTHSASCSRFPNAATATISLDVFVWKCQQTWVGGGWWQGQWCSTGCCHSKCLWPKRKRCRVLPETAATSRGGLSPANASTVAANAAGAAAIMAPPCQRSRLTRALLSCASCWQRIRRRYCRMQTLGCWANGVRPRAWERDVAWGVSRYGKSCNGRYADQASSL